MGRHALLSASSSHRWIACPPSARLCENYGDTGSEYAQQGTDAHSLCEHKLKQSLGMDTSDPTAGLSFYDEEMEECACGYECQRLLPLRLLYRRLFLFLCRFPGLSHFLRLLCIRLPCFRSPVIGYCIRNGLQAVSKGTQVTDHLKQ